MVVVVWDGMRPDLVTPENAPTLCRLAEEGVTFRNHHAVYLSATHVNGTAIETGMYPEHNGVIANYDYRPEIEKQKFISTEQQKVIQKGGLSITRKILECADAGGIGATIRRPNGGRSRRKQSVFSWIASRIILPVTISRFPRESLCRNQPCRDYGDSWVISRLSNVRACSTR